MAEALIGPVLSDILSIADGKNFVLASAFYSEARLDATTIAAQSADILVRLDLNSIDTWVSRAIAPDALLRLWQRHKDVDIKVFYSPGAHAKIYSGDREFLVGSANFTVRGLGGTSDELLWRERDVVARRRMARALAEYRSALKPLTLARLESYVRENLAAVRKQQKKAEISAEDSLPTDLRRPGRVGNYDEFLLWLALSKTEAAKETLARANGKGQLSGHIRMNFYGIRQFLLGHPAQARHLRETHPDNYRLCDDTTMESALKRFVNKEAVDEGGLCADTWRTYLPMRSGGKPKSGGGTSGNLNRMLPLLARYLSRKGR